MSIPHAYAAVECSIDLLLSFRKQMKVAGVAVSVNDFVIKAVALALKECPLVNCLYMNDQVICILCLVLVICIFKSLVTPSVNAALFQNVKNKSIFSHIVDFFFNFE